MKLRNKILLATLSIIVFFGVLTTGAVYYVSRTQLVETQRKALHNATDNFAAELSQVLIFSQGLAEKLAQQQAVVDYLSGIKKVEETVNQNSLLSLFQSYNIAERYASIYLMDRSGQTLLSTDETFTGNNYATRKYFQQALSGSPGFQVAIGRTSGELGYYFSAPVNSDKGEILGVIVFKMQPFYLSSLMQDKAREHRRVIMLSDEEGFVVFASDPEKRLENIDTDLGYKELAVAIANYEQSDTYVVNKQHDAEREIVSVSRLRDYPIFLIEQENISLFFQPAILVAQTISAFVLVAALSAALVIAVSVSSFTRPLGKLLDYTKKVTAGNYDLDFTLKDNSEIGQVFRAFERMIRAIKESRKDVDRKVREQTEEIVKKQKYMEDQKKALLNILEDVEEEKKKADELAQDLAKFKLAVENATDQIVITDAEGMVLYANKAMEEITGYTRKEALGTKAGTLWGKLMSQDYYEKMWRTIKVDKKDFIGEITNKRKNGQKYVASVNIAPIMNDENKVLFFVAIERDITKSKEIDRMKTDFISLVSHQLRTPLSAMRWFLEMLLNGDAGKLNDEQREYVKNVDQSNQRMIALVNSLLNISRIESGRIIIDPKPTDLLNLLKTLIEELKPRLKEKKQKLLVEVHPHLPKVLLDPKLIRNVYLNLLTNAIKYSSEGSEIEVFVSKKGDQLLSRISDSGYGIPATEKDKIFQRFFRASNVVKRETEGNGLGLYLAKAVVESSGGKIWFESEEGKGTSFWFTLPIKGVKPKAGEVSLTETSI